jgi:hypothetical protein
LTLPNSIFIVTTTIIIIIIITIVILWAGMAQSIYRLGHGWRAREPGFDSWQKQELNFYHTIQTGSGAHHASYATGTDSFVPRGGG